MHCTQCIKSVSIYNIIEVPIQLCKGQLKYYNQYHLDKIVMDLIITTKVEWVDNILAIFSGITVKVSKGLEILFQVLQIITTF